MRVVYCGPDGKLIFDPSSEQPTEILLTTGQDYWLRGGNGEASLDMMRELGESVASHRSKTTADGVTIEYVMGQPSLLIKQPEAKLYFLTWCPVAGEDL